MSNDHPADAPAPLTPLKRSPAELERLKRLSKAGAAAVERMHHEMARAQVAALELRMTVLEE